MPYCCSVIVISVAILTQALLAQAEFCKSCRHCSVYRYYSGMCECTGCEKCRGCRGCWKSTEHQSTCGFPLGKKWWQKGQRRCHWCAIDQSNIRDAGGTCDPSFPLPQPMAEPADHGNARWQLTTASCENPVTKTPMTLGEVLQQGGDFWWNGSCDQRFHVQTQKVVSSSPLVVLWLSGSGGHKELAASPGQTGPTATAIHDSAILVSPHSSLKYRADVPDWIVKLTGALTQEVGGRLVLVGFSRGAKWCHEILRELITMNMTMPLRCLLVAPYCAAKFDVHEKHKHVVSIKQGRTTVRSICSMQDECCPWDQYGEFIQGMGDWRDVTRMFPKHSDTLSGLLWPGSSDVASDIQWLLARDGVRGQ